MPFLEPDESTVGTFLKVRHLPPTPIGATVTCRARVVQAGGPVVSFQLEAQDEHEVIGRGMHKLCVINVDRFAKKVRGKKGNPT